jgi:hypothetical protein
MASTTFGASTGTVLGTMPEGCLGALLRTPDAESSASGEGNLLVSWIASNRGLCHGKLRQGQDASLKARAGRVVPLA